MPLPTAKATTRVVTAPSPPTLPESSSSSSLCWASYASSAASRLRPGNLACTWLTPSTVTGCSSCAAEIISRHTPPGPVKVWEEGRHAGHSRVLSLQPAGGRSGTLTQSLSGRALTPPSPRKHTDTHTSAHTGAHQSRRPCALQVSRLGSTPPAGAVPAAPAQCSSAGRSHRDTPAWCRPCRRPRGSGPAPTADSGQGAVVSGVGFG